MANSNTTAVAVTEKTVAAFVADVLPNLRNYKVRNYDESAWAKTAMLCIADNPELMACLATPQGKTSLYHALRYAAVTGLSLNPQEAKACLVPIQGKIHYWLEKAGIIDLVLETGAVAYIRANAVRQNDRFRVTESFEGDAYEFSPATRQRGEIIGFFCAIRLKTGGNLVHWMTVEEVQAHRDTYGKGLDRKDSAWRKSFEGMGVKTVIKMACARLSLPREAMRVIEAAEPETVAGEWVEVPGAGTGAADLEKTLKEKQAQGKKAEGEKPAEGAKAPEPEKTGDVPAAADAGTAGAPAGDPSQVGTGDAPKQAEGTAPKKPRGELDIF